MALTIRVLQGSGTVAMITSAGLVATYFGPNFNVNASISLKGDSYSCRSDWIFACK